MDFDDLRSLAEKYLPQILFDYIEGGCNSEIGVATNRVAFENLRFVPRYLQESGSRSQRTTLFGTDFDSPFGIAPMGSPALIRPRGDVVLAAAAHEANIPFVLSDAGTASYAEICEAHPGAWVQLYIPKSRDILLHKVDAMNEAGFSTLVVTIDVPAHSKRHRMSRHGWSLSSSISPPLGVAIEALRHPTWLARYIRQGFPYMESWRAYAAQGATARDAASVFTAQVPAPQTWSTIAEIRNRWSGNLVVKGILDPRDAVRAVEIGADGILISNHGGRQIDQAVPPIQMLPLIREAVGVDATLMLDSGVRSGSDAIAALALGAKMVFVGRPALYGLAAGGGPGVQRAITIMQEEIDLFMAQVGLSNVTSVLPDIIHGRA